MDHSILTTGRSQHGFTLMEVITFMTLSALVLTGALFFFRTGAESYAETLSQSLALEAFHHANRLMTRDIRNLRNQSSIATATVSQFTFTNVQNQSISYTFSSGQLLRNGVSISSGLTSFSLTYATWDGASWSSGATTEIAMVTATLSTSVEGRLLATSSSILLRNAR